MTRSDPDPLTRPIAAPGDAHTKPFGEFSASEVRARAAELRAAVGLWVVPPDGGLLR